MYAPMFTVALFAVASRPRRHFCFLAVKAATAQQRRQQDNETTFHMFDAAICPSQTPENDRKNGNRLSHGAFAIERSSDD
ncbi:hypothetical protein S4A8_18271 [Salinisphaera sp. S4-8]